MEINTKYNEEQLLEKLASDVESVVKTLLVLRKPTTAYEINKSIDAARSIIHWVADGYGAIKFAKTE